MNNFDFVFMTVKEQCDEDGVLKEDGYERITKTLNDKDIQLSLETYLNIMEVVGLITYAKGTKKIKLTEKGTVSDKLF